MVRVLVAVVALAAGAVAGFASPASAKAPFVEVNYQDPITAVPPVPRPPAPHCTVQVMRHDFAFSYGQPFVGPFAPPAGCPGPWSKVVLEWDGSIAGRQFDRFAGVWIGGVELLRTTTPEPDPDGIHWHVEKDVSQYATVLSKPQTAMVDLGNLVNGTYTGVFHITLSLTFYETGPGAPAAAHPDQVVPISQTDESSAWFVLNDATQTASRTLTLPANLTSAKLEVYASAHGCEEFWYGNVPDPYAQQHPDAGLCGGGAFREIQVLVDGRLAGVATPFPVVYTGGVNPFMWRPIPSVQTFDLAPFPVDLTPFAGVLSDGAPHTIAVRIANNTGFWPVDANLLLDQDAHAAATGGKLLVDTVAPAATVTFDQTSAGGVDHLMTTAHRTWTVKGYVNTSAGRVVTTVQQDMATSNDQHDTISGVNGRQVIAQSQRTLTVTTVEDAAGRHVTRVNDDYPLRVTSDYSEQTESNGDHGFTLLGDADLSLRRHVTTSDGHAIRTSSLDDHINARGTLVRDLVTGKNLAADGDDREHYRAATADACVDNFLRAKHGWVVEQRFTAGCP